MLVLIIESINEDGGITYCGQLEMVELIIRYFLESLPPPLFLLRVQLAELKTDVL